MLRRLVLHLVALLAICNVATGASAQVSAHPPGMPAPTIEQKPVLRGRLPAPNRSLDYSMEFSENGLVVNGKSGNGGILPEGVKPISYAISIAPDPESMRYEATVRIDVELSQRLDAITLNALDLTLMRATIDGRHADIFIDRETQTAAFQTMGSLKPGRHTLSIGYSGILDTHATGFFASDYQRDGVTKRALFTQFEPVNARKVIPSWDEPAYKATFSLEMIVKDPASMAVSNMPVIERTRLPDGRMRFRFATTPAMSIYLLFFAVGEFERTAQAASTGTEIGVVTRRGELSKAGFALAASKDIIAWYNDYFQKPYPLPKLDNIAAPGNSQYFSAMENWGAILYFERAMLLDPRISSNADRKRVFANIAHEMGHQWFGNLVTMRWWDDLWLNEGFASWMEGKAIARLHPDWRPELDAVPTRERAMALDGLQSTHPIIQPVANPDEMEQAFDAITYAKGEAVIRMLENWIGEDAWRNGVRRYLAAHAYGSARSDELWEAIEAESGKHVTDMAHQFTHQSGVPMIEVEGATCNGGRTTLTLGQSEFALDRPSSKVARWDVPVVADVIGYPSTTVVVTDQKATATLEGCGTVVVNSGQTGYFRTRYAPALFTTLVRDFARLPTVDQLGVLADTWAMGLTGRQAPTDALDLVASLPLNADPELWSYGAQMMDQLASFSGYDAVRRKAVERYASVRFGPKLAALGWTPAPGESEGAAELRATLIDMLGRFGDPAVVAEARRLYAADRTAPIPDGLRRPVMTVVAANGDRPMWDYLLKLALAEKSPMLRSEYYRLLASTNDERLAFETLRLTLTDDTPDEDAVTILQTVALRYPELAFEWGIAFREVIEPKVSENGRSKFFVNLLGRSAEGMMLPRLESWVKVAMTVEQRRAADPAIAMLRYRAMVRSLRLPQIYDWVATAAVLPALSPRP